MNTMQLYTLSDCMHCHRVRFVLAEKGINVRIIETDNNAKANDDMAELTPYGDAPTLVDRDIVLYGTSVICEYLDERYPHPPLMPVDPISRARLRLSHYRIKRDWFSLASEIVEANNTKKPERPAPRLIRELRESITAADDLFGISKFMLNEDLSLVDCSLVPFFWRLPSLGVNISRNATNVKAYTERLFERPSFRASLTNAEKQLIES